MSERLLNASVIRFEDLRGARKNKIDQWIRSKMKEDYGDDDKETIENPLLRITTKFEALSEEGQIKLFGFAKNRIGAGPGLKDMFWDILKYGGRSDGSWEDVEKFADSMLSNEWSCKNTLE